jgi:peptidoglycan hydrolase-like protein with peptidoglycan-binding domain
MLVTRGYEPGTYGLDKDGVDGSFGKLTETAVNDFQEKNRGREEPIRYLGVK